MSRTIRSIAVRACPSSHSNSMSGSCLASSYMGSLRYQLIASRKRAATSVLDLWNYRSFREAKLFIVKPTRFLLIVRVAAD